MTVRMLQTRRFAAGHRFESFGGRCERLCARRRRVGAIFQDAKRAEDAYANGVGSSTRSRLSSSAGRCSPGSNLIRAPADHAVAGARPCGAAVTRFHASPDAHGRSRTLRARRGAQAPQSVPMTVLLPAFAVGELRAGFAIGFALYLPFVAIDLAVASILMGLGNVHAESARRLAAGEAPALRDGRRLGADLQRRCNEL